MKHPKPDRLVVMLGTPMTVHSAQRQTEREASTCRPACTAKSAAIRRPTTHAPRLVVAREDAEVTPAHELLVVEAEDRVVRVEELRESVTLSPRNTDLGVEDDLDAILRPVEELDAPDLVQDRVVGIVGHVVRRDRRQGVATEREDAALQQDLVLGRQQRVGVGHLGAGLAAGISFGLAAAAHPL